MANYKTIYEVKELLELQKKMNRKSDLRKIRRAYDFAEKAHENQKRLSGEKYIIHPLNVAYILADLSLDDNTRRSSNNCRWGYKTR